MGTPGHMQHPFDTPSVETGQDLIDYFINIANHLKNNPASVKFDGINVSFKLIDDKTKPSGKDFRMDRGTSHIESVVGMTAEDAYSKWPEGHGMPPAIETLLSIFNKALPLIEPELKELGMWDDPTKFFNTEYMKQGKTNVIEYPENILAIHGINQFYEKLAQPFRVQKGESMDRPGLERPNNPETGKPIKGAGPETDYNREALNSLIEKVKPIAEESEFSLVGDVPTEVIADIDFVTTLKTLFPIQMTADEEEVYPLREWLAEATNPREAKVTKSDGTQVWAISKDVYVAVLDKIPLLEYLRSPEDVKMAINGAVFNHTTRMLGNDVKRALDSSKGAVEGHEGIVIRGLEDKPVKVTGDFIVQGLQSVFQEGVIKEQTEDEIELEIEDENTEKTNIAVYPGRFQPMGQHHAEVFKQLEADENFDETYIATADKTDPTEIDGVPKSPFSFEEKKQIIMQHGIPEEKIVSVKNPYNATEVLQNYEPGTVSITYFVGEKDMQEDPRFQKTGGTTKDGYDWAIEVAPHVSFDIPEVGEMSGTNIRKALKNSDPETFESIMGWYDPILYDLIKTRLNRLEESQLPLGIFLRLIEETLEEAPLTQMYGSWAGNLAGITPAGMELEEDMQDIQNLGSDSIVYKPSNIHGRGAFSSNGHKKDVILGLALKKIDNNEIRNNYHTFHNLGSGAPQNLVIGFSKKTGNRHAIGSVDGGNVWHSQTDLGNWINHSPKPNTILIQVDDDLYLKAVENVGPGEEFTTDYRHPLSPVRNHPTEEWDQKAMQCATGGEELEEISAMGGAGGADVEGYANKIEEEEEGLIREVEDYLFSTLGVN